MRGAEISDEMTIFLNAFRFVISLILMSENPVNSSEIVKSEYEIQLEEEIDGFKKRAKDWYQALNDEHRKETRQLMAENKKLKDEISVLRKRLKDALLVKPKTTPPQVRRAEQEAHKKEHEEALKKAYEAIEKFKAENEGYKKALAANEEESKKMKEERDVFKLAFMQHSKMQEKLQEKLYFFIPKEDLNEEMDEMWHQAVEETKE